MIDALFQVSWLGKHCQIKLLRQQSTSSIHKLSTSSQCWTRMPGQNISWKPDIAYYTKDKSLPPVICNSTQDKATVLLVCFAGRKVNRHRPPQVKNLWMGVEVTSMITQAALCFQSRWVLQMPDQNYINYLGEWIDVHCWALDLLSTGLQAFLGARS